MKSVTYSHARQNLADTIKMVCEDHAPVVIYNQKENAVVLLSLDDYEALEETAYLLRSPQNSRRLFESIKQLESGKGKVKELLK